MVGVDDRIDGCLLRELRVEVGDVRLAADVWLVDGRVLLVVDLLERDRREEGVPLQLLDVARPRAEAAQLF